MVWFGFMAYESLLVSHLTTFYICVCVCVCVLQEENIVIIYV